MQGINREIGLKSTMGNEQLLLRLLTKFANTYSEFTHSFNQALSSDPDEATRLAHSLKGNAGSLGMLDLQEASKTLEMACRNQQGNYDELVAKVQQELDIVLQSIQENS